MTRVFNPSTSELTLHDAEPRPPRKSAFILQYERRVAGVGNRLLSYRSREHLARAFYKFVAKRGYYRPLKDGMRPPIVITLVDGRKRRYEAGLPFSRTYSSYIGYVENLAALRAEDALMVEFVLDVRTKHLDRLNRFSGNYQERLSQERLEHLHAAADYERAARHYTDLLHAAADFRRGSTLLSPLDIPVDVAECAWALLSLRRALKNRKQQQLRDNQSE
jgi:hypothetical protein